MRRFRLSIIIYIILVFLSGVLVGAVGHRFYAMQVVSAVAKRPRPSPEEYRRHYVEELRTRLKLTDQQVRKVNEALDAMLDRFRAEIKALQEDQARQIRAILNPEQQKEYERMRQQREERRKQSQKPSPSC